MAADEPGPPGHYSTSRGRGHGHARGHRPPDAAGRALVGSAAERREAERLVTRSHRVGVGIDPARGHPPPPGRGRAVAERDGKDKALRRVETERDQKEARRPTAPAPNTATDQ